MVTVQQNVFNNTCITYLSIFLLFIFKNFKADQRQSAIPLCPVVCNPNENFLYVVGITLLVPVESLTNQSHRFSYFHASYF